MEGIDLSILESFSTSGGKIGLMGFAVFIVANFVKSWISHSKTQEHADTATRDTITTLQAEVARRVARENELVAAHEADINRISELQVQVGKLEAELTIYKQPHKGE